MVLDSASAARTIGAEVAAIAASIEVLAQQSKDQLPTAIQQPSVADTIRPLDFDDRGDFVVDTETAWPISVSHMRRVSVAENTSVESVKLARLAD